MFSFPAWQQDVSIGVRRRWSSAWQQDGSPQWSRVIPADSVCLSDDGTDRPHHCSCTSHCYSRNILRLVWPRIKYWYGRCVLYCFTNIIFKTNPNNLSPVSRWGAGELEGGRADMSNCNKIVTSCLLSEYDGSSSKNSKLNPKSCFA